MRTSPRRIAKSANRHKKSSISSRNAP